MPFNSLVARSDFPASPEFVTDVFRTTLENSSVLRNARRLRDMTRQQQRFPVTSLLPSAYFVNGDTDKKQTTKMQWTDKYLTAEELAVIVPIPEAALADAEFDIEGQIRQSLPEAFGLAIDQAVYYGTNKPATWPDAIVTYANSIGHKVSLAEAVDLYEATAGENGHIAMLEQDGFVANGHVGAISLRSKMRGARDADGNPLFRTVMNGPAASSFGYEFDGTPVQFPRNGAINDTLSLLISGDWSQLVYSMRQDITLRVLTEATIFDAAGDVMYSLAQQDMVAIRAVMRLGFALPNPVNRVNSNNATRYPFSILVP